MKRGARYASKTQGPKRVLATLIGIALALAGCGRAHDGEGAVSLPGTSMASSNSYDTGGFAAPTPSTGGVGVNAIATGGIGGPFSLTGGIATGGIGASMVATGGAGGGVGGSGDSGDASVPPTTTAGQDHCAGAMRLALGGTISGSTCGGITISGFCTGLSTPVVYVLVDAAEGTALHFTLSAGASISAYPTCQSDMGFECAFNPPTFDPGDDRYRLFSINRADTKCGDFTLSVTAR